MAKLKTIMLITGLVLMQQVASAGIIVTWQNSAGSFISLNWPVTNPAPGPIALGRLFGFSGAGATFAGPCQSPLAGGCGLNPGAVSLANGNGSLLNLTVALGNSAGNPCRPLSILGGISPGKCRPAPQNPPATAVLEPSSLAMLAIGVLGLFFARRRMR